MKAIAKCSVRHIIEQKETDNMNMNYNKNAVVKFSCIKWAFALMPVIIGGTIYLLYRPKNILLFSTLNEMGIMPRLEAIRKSAELYHLPNFVVYSLPAGLWTASYLMAMYMMTKHCTRRTRLSLSLPLPISAIASEFMQLFDLCPGTFDVDDLICYIIPIVIFLKLI